LLCGLQRVQVETDKESESQENGSNYMSKERGGDRREGGVEGRIAHRSTQRMGLQDQRDSGRHGEVMLKRR